MEQLKVIAFTHKNIPLELLGKLHLDLEEQASVLGALKLQFEFSELMFLSTCNRVEFIISSERELERNTLAALCSFVNSRLNSAEASQLAEAAEIHQGEGSVRHLLRVASSLESLVVGEREIITQVRKAYDHCNMLGLTGDLIRLLMRHTIETAKEVYTQTGIAHNPVSIVSLAYRQLKEMGIKNNAKLLFVGSGVTNTSMAKYLQKHKFANFAVFNRTKENAVKLASNLGGTAFGLDQLTAYKEGFDVLIVCTSSSSPVITTEVYRSLLNGDQGKKIVIDLGLPANVEQNVINSKINYIDIGSLKKMAETNLELRKGEIGKCEEIIDEKTSQFGRLHHERSIELAFGEIPRRVKAIRETAVNEVFAKELGSLDENGKLLLDKVLSYVEKKYNAVAIKTAKEVLRNTGN